jgi:hypothetical protein
MILDCCQWLDTSEVQAKFGRPIMDEFITLYGVDQVLALYVYIMGWGRSEERSYVHKFERSPPLSGIYRSFIVLISLIFIPMPMPKSKIIFILRFIRIGKRYSMALFAFVLIRCASRADQVCGVCEQGVDVSRQFTHFEIGDNQDIQGAACDKAAFREEIFGRNFTIFVSRLSAGKYTVIIGEAETYFASSNQRISDIIVGEKIMATDLDIFSAAGGANEAFYLTNEIDHLDDSMHGPLQVTFTAHANNAKFNITFGLKNIGQLAGDEVAQVYFRHINSAVSRPKLALHGFTRIHLTPSKTAQVGVAIPVERLRYLNITKKQYVVEAGDYELLMGVASDDIRLHVPLKVATL